MKIAEQNFYDDVREIRKNLDRIAEALEAIAKNAPSASLDIDRLANNIEKTIIHRNQ